MMKIMKLNFGTILLSIFDNRKKSIINNKYRYFVDKYRYFVDK